MIRDELTFQTSLIADASAQATQAGSLQVASYCTATLYSTCIAKVALNLCGFALQKA